MKLYHVGVESKTIGSRIKESRAKTSGASCAKAEQSVTIKRINIKWEKRKLQLKLTNQNLPHQGNSSGSLEDSNLRQYQKHVRRNLSPSRLSFPL